MEAYPLDGIASLLTAYAELQRTFVGDVGSLLSFGLPDRRMPQASSLLDMLMDSPVVRFGLSSNEQASFYAWAEAIRPSLWDACLAISPITTLEHGDFHLGNVLYKDGDLWLIDWGDSCLTHPFISMLLLLEKIVKQLPPSERGRTAVYLRDAYLEPWSQATFVHDMQTEFEIALWLGHFLRLLNFEHMFRGADQAAMQKWAPALMTRTRGWIETVGSREPANWLDLLLV